VIGEPILTRRSDAVTALITVQEESMAVERRSAKRWQELVSEWECTDLPAIEFARRRGLNVSTLRWWRWKLRSDGLRGSAAVAPAFLEVVVEEPEPPDLVVELGGNLRVRVPAGFDARELRRLVVALC